LQLGKRNSLTIFRNSYVKNRWVLQKNRTTESEPN